MSAPHFVDVRPRPLHRTLAGYLPILGELVTEWGEVLRARDYAELRSACFEHSLLTYSAPLPPGIVAAAVADPSADVFVYQKELRGVWYGEDTTHRVGAVRMRQGLRGGGLTTRWLVPWRAWDLPPEPDSLTTLRRTFRLAGVGDCSTPSALGLALLRRDWDRSEPLLFRPPWPLLRDLHAYVVGGRAEAFHPTQRYPVAWGLDLRGAYPAAARAVPAGWPVSIRGEPPAAAVATYSVCAVRAPGGGMTLGPAARRQGGRLDYPTEGSWTAPYWHWQVEQLRAAGAEVRRGAGVCWMRLSRGMAPWAERLFALRLRAPADVAYLLKGAAVAALGRFGVTPEQAVLLAAPRTRADVPLIDDRDEPGDFWVHRELRDSGLLLPQVASYIHASVQVQVYERALVEAEAGHLIGTNFDAVYTSRPVPEPREAALGEWRSQEIPDFRMSARRTLLSSTPGVTRRPGVKRTA